MKLRTSYFNSTAFRKNITRFLPLWVLYTVMLLLILMLISDSDHRYLAQSIVETIPAFGFFNLVYAFLCAAVLFGDLFSSRLCNALHAMPLRREGWFLTNLSSGLAFSLAPTALCAVLCTLLLINNPVEGAWQIPWLVAGAANMQFLFFFALAVLSVFCSGNRIAMLLVYGLLNFGAMLVYWMAEVLYVPMLEGVVIQLERYTPFSPAVHMASLEYLDVTLVHSNDNYYYPIGGSYEFLDGWSYLGIFAAIGIALLVVSLLLYRKRKLECAGDFMAVKPLEPVFLVVYSVAAGCLFQMTQSVFGVYNEVTVMLFIGIVIGWFTGRMLLTRSLRVFGKKNLLGCAVLLLAMGASLFVTYLDPLGIAGWVPKAESVESVTLSPYRNSSDGLTLTEPEEIEALLQAHATAIAEPDTVSLDEVPDAGRIRSINFTLTYTLTNGTTAVRTYDVLSHRECARLLKPYFSSAAYIFGTDADLDTLAGMVKEFYLRDTTSDPAEVRSLLEAILKDCEAGTIAQQHAYHENSDTVYWMSFSLAGASESDPRLHVYRSLEVYKDSANTVQWLEERGLLEETPADKYLGW